MLLFFEADRPSLDLPYYTIEQVFYFKGEIVGSRSVYLEAYNYYPYFGDMYPSFGDYSIQLYSIPLITLILSMEL